jgi:hypothetical protein
MADCSGRTGRARYIYVVCHLQSAVIQSNIPACVPQTHPLSSGMCIEQIGMSWMSVCASALTSNTVH